MASLAPLSTPDSRLQDSAPGATPEVPLLAFGDALDHAPFACIRLDSRGLVSSANSAACALVGIEPSRRRRPVFSAFVVSEDLAAYFAFVAQLGSAERALRCTLRIRGNGVDERWVQLEGKVVGDCALVSLSDVTEREAALVRLRESEEQTQELLRALPDAVFVIKAGVVVVRNPAALVLTGGKDPLGRALHSFVTNPDALADTLMPFQLVKRELRFGREGEAARVVETMWLPIRLGGDDVTLCVARDRTQQRALESRVAEKDRLATVGVLAAGVAHELNNPLTYVMMNLTASLRVLEPAAGSDGAEQREILENLRHAQDGAKRMAKIVEDLREVVRPAKPGATVDIRTVLSHAIDIAAPHQRTTGVVTMRGAPSVVARGDDGRLTQVFVNLITNACDALPATRGRLDISIRVSEETVEVDVRDNGSGIPAATRGRVFEPFFTTKEVGRGTGLGLYVSRQYVELCGGTIRVESPDEGGTAVIVTLERALERTGEQAELERARAGDPAACQASPARPERLPRILVVDDEPLIRLAFERWFRGTAEIAVAEDAQTAIALLDELEPGFDLILCDLFMPGGSGRAVYEYVKTHHEALLSGFSIMTGGAVDPRDVQFLRTEAPSCLHKPFSSSDAAEFVRRRIEAVAAPQLLPPLEAARD